jgi:Tol biopolymer transport system component
LLLPRRDQDATYSPDGRSLAFDSRPDGYFQIFTLACHPGGERCGKPKPLTTGGPAETPSWSADGKFLYFASDRTGRWQIWKVAASGGRPLQVTHHGGYLCHESSDGKWLYFSKDGHDSIWRIPASGLRNPPGEAEELVIGPPYKVQSHSWTLTSGEIVFYDRATSTHSAAIRAYSIRTKQMRLILSLSHLFPDNRGEIGISLSPDSRWILYSQLDRSGSNVMVADRIH